MLDHRSYSVGVYWEMTRTGKKVHVEEEMRDVVPLSMTADGVAIDALVAAAAAFDGVVLPPMMMSFRGLC